MRRPREPSLLCPKKTKNPNPSPIGNRFGFFLFGGGDGSRTIKFDIATSKTHHKLTKEQRYGAASLVCIQFAFCHLGKIVLPEMLPKSALRFLKSCRCRGSQIFTLALQFMPVYAGCIHVLAMTYKHLQLAVSQDAGFNADKGVSQLVK